jgi:hypothetical protein
MFDRLVHLGDILAIPFFLALVIYFYRIEYKTRTESILFLFSIGGLLADLIFTVAWLRA